MKFRSYFLQLSAIERYAMRFVEETGGLWTAEQLRAAEAEIEQQKREWEANRLAALKKEEDDARRTVDDEENELLTYSREDAKNQVNNNRIKAPVNRRLVSVREVSSASASSLKRQRSLKRRRPIVTKASTDPVPPAPVTRRPAAGMPAAKRSKLANRRKESKEKSQKPSPPAKTKAAAAMTKKKRKIRSPPPTRRVLRRKCQSSANLTVETADDENDESQTSTTTETPTTQSDDVGDGTGSGVHGGGGGADEFDDSECSLDVMIDSTDAAESDSTRVTNNSLSDEDDDDDDENSVEDDDEDGDEHDDDEDDLESQKSGGKENLEIKNRRQSVHNQVDINSPRTRSRGTVKLNLWTLDVSPILPDMRTGKRKSLRSGGADNNSIVAADNKSELVDADDSSSVTASTTTTDFVESESNSIPTDGKPRVFQPTSAPPPPTPPQSFVVPISTASNLKQTKIVDGFAKQSVADELKTTASVASASITMTPSTKMLPKKKRKLAMNGEDGKGSRKLNTLDKWISSSPRTKRALSPMVVLSKDDVSKHFNQVTSPSVSSSADLSTAATANTNTVTGGGGSVRNTRRSSIFKSNSTNPSTKTPTILPPPSANGTV